MMKDGEAQGPSRALEALLARLGPDPETAGVEFERLRRTLTRFFDWRGSAWPEECADETLDRLARKLDEGVDVQNISAFASGIARLVLHEAARASSRTVGFEGLDPIPAPPVEAPEDRPIAACLDKCLAELSKDGRQLVLDYYAERGRHRIESRQRSARRLGLTESALRSRVQRLRDRLEVCVRACLGGEAHRAKSENAPTRSRRSKHSRTRDT